MEIANLELKEGVQVQIKSLNKGGKSKSFTIHNTDVKTTYNRIFFLFEMLSKTDNEITIIHYKDKEEKKDGKPRVN